MNSIEFVEACVNPFLLKQITTKPRRNRAKPCGKFYFYCKELPKINSSYNEVILWQQKQIKNIHSAAFKIKLPLNTN